MPRPPDLHDLARDAKQNGRKLLAVYLTCGFPEIDWAAQLAHAVFQAGADILELGMPFSDPLADGPTIQAASQRALDNGVTSKEYFEIAAHCAELGPTLFMGYLNSLTSIPRFLEGAHDAGMCGLIIPDWPVSGNFLSEFERNAKRLHLPRIPFVAPTSTPERVETIDAMNAPFVYAVSVTGVTGARSSIEADVDSYLATLKRQLKTPFLVGFGVSSPEAAKRFAQYANGVIVGSALLNGIAAADNLDAALRFVRDFVSSLRRAIDAPTNT